MSDGRNSLLQKKKKKQQKTDTVRKLAFHII